MCRFFQRCTLSVEKQFMSGTSTSLYSTEAVGAPVCPLSGSSKYVVKEAPVDSVYPYPSTIGTQAMTFMKSITSFEIGADDVTRKRQRPPKIALVFLNTRLSQMKCVYFPFFKLPIFAFNAIFRIFFQNPVVFSNCYRIKSQNRLYKRGTDMKYVGFTSAKSSFNFYTSPEQQLETQIQLVLVIHSRTINQLTV